LPEQARQRIAEGLGLLGTACAKLGNEVQGEEVLRLAVQYAQDGKAAAEIFLRLGKMFLDGERWGEAIGPLRRARALGSKPEEVLPDIVRAFVARDRGFAALAFVLEAEDKGLADDVVGELRKSVKDKLGDGLGKLETLLAG